MKEFFLAIFALCIMLFVAILPFTIIMGTLDALHRKWKLGGSRGDTFHEMRKLMFSVLEAASMSFIFATPTYFLWNWLMPEILGIKEIDFWEAWGINFLAAILFKNWSPQK